MKTLKLAMVAASLIALHGCGGSSGGSANDGTRVISGKAFDGAFVNAKVCVDLNRNNMCDNGEPETLTDEQGGYELTVSGEAADFPILVRGTADTYDVDNPDQLLPDLEMMSFVALQDSNGQVNINPVTHNIATGLAVQPLVKISELKEKVREALGLPAGADLTANFSSEAEANKAIQNAAKVLFAASQKAQEDFEAATAGKNLSDDEKKALYRAAQNNALAAAQTVIAANGGDLSGLSDEDIEAAKDSVTVDSLPTDEAGLKQLAEEVQEELDQQSTGANGAGGGA